MKNVILCVLILLAGCGNLQNVTADDIRNPGHLRAEKDFPLSIDSIEQALYAHSSKCRFVGRVIRNPGDASEGYISAEMPGLTKSSVALLIDLKQKGGATQARGYTYYSTWTDHIQTIFKAIESPDVCSK